MGIGLLLSGVVLALIFGGAITLKVIQSARADSVDRVSLCPLTGPSGLTVIALDATDPFDAVQVQEVNNSVRELLGRVEEGHRIDIFTMNATRNQLATRVFSKCNPGRATRLDQVAGQPTQREAEYREQFADAINRALSTAIETGAAERSPIVESMRAIAAQSLADAPADASRRIIVISDLVQHSDVYSMFGNGPGSFDRFSRSPDYADARTDLRGAEVDFLAIMRSEYARYQTRELSEWWADYVLMNNGKVGRFRPL